MELAEKKSLKKVLRASPFNVAARMSAVSGNWELVPLTAIKNVGYQQEY
jgi:hypothetical protein